MPSNVIWGSDGMQFKSTATVSLPLGTIMKFLDGREFAYTRVDGTTAMVTGCVQQQAVAVTTDIINLAVPSAEIIGATAVGVTNQTTLVANYYAEGYLFTNTGTGYGYTYKIKSHLGAGAAEVTINLEEGSGLRVAWDTTTKVGLRKHPCDGALIAPIAETGSVIGVSVRAVTEAYYCWVQKKGPCAVLTNGTVIVGEGVVRGATTPGSVDAWNDDASTTNALVLGDVMSVGTTAHYSLINLNIR